METLASKFELFVRKAEGLTPDMTRAFRLAYLGGAFDALELVSAAARRAMDGNKSVLEHTAAAMVALGVELHQSKHEIHAEIVVAAQIAKAKAG